MVEDNNSVEIALLKERIEMLEKRLSNLIYALNNVAEGYYLSEDANNEITVNYELY